jgi:hypothetical protein
MKRRLILLTLFVPLIVLAALVFAPAHPTQAQSAWAPNVSYSLGQLVTYGGSTYKCLTAHTSQTGWEPSNVPALWQLQTGGGGTVPTNTPAPQPTQPPPSGTTNVARGKAATSLNTCAASEGPGLAVDGSTTTKWCGFVSGGNTWMRVDLGGNYNVSSFTVKHAGAGGENTAWNTKDFQIQTSSDGSTFSTAVTVTGNTSSTTTHSIATRTTRYIRLWITIAGADSAARIYEFEVYGSSAGGTVPTNTPVPATGFAVSEAQFNAWFPNRNGLYTYANFLTARGAYSGFAGSSDATANKREAAAFFAHVAHETNYLFYVHEQNYPVGHYCGGNAAYGCAAGADYHGRGPLQLSWNYNYKMAATGQYYQNGSTWVTVMTPSVGYDIWSNPDIVATNGIVTWKTALWYWMNHGKDWDPAQPTVHEDFINIGFGETTRDINGGLECGQPAGSVGNNQMLARQNIYNTFLSNLGVSDTRSKTC